MTDEREQLQQARDLIMRKRFADARAILYTLPNNPTARKWIAKLDELDPAAPPRPIPRPPAGTWSSQETDQILLAGRTIRYGASGVVITMAILMIAGFFLFSWLDMGNLFGGFGGMLEEADVESSTDMKITAMEIWMGNNSGENFTLGFDSIMNETSSNSGGIANVRLLDRFLILIPIGALILLGLAWMYASGEMAPITALTIMTVLSLLLLLFPLGWQELSERNWESSMKESMAADFGDAGLEGDVSFDFGFSALFVGLLTDLYSTGEQQLLGGIAFAACLMALLVELTMRGSALQAR